MPHRTATVVILLLSAAFLLPGCKSDEKAEYAKPLPPGAFALRKIDPAEWPDLSRVGAMDDGFVAALKRSLAWFSKPSTRQFYPMGDITHDRARATLYALPNMAWDAGSTDAFIARLRDECDMYESVGWDGLGTVLYTGYYTPILPASRVPTGEYRYPLYKRPADLVADPVTGEVQGRRVGDRIQPYPARRVIEQTNMLRGSELVYLKSRLDAYLVEVQGSAKLRMTDGTSMLVGFAGTNGHEYASLRQMLVDAGALDKDTANLPAIRDYFRDHPGELNRYIQRNDRFIFFTEYAGDNWPAGSLGVKVEPMRSLATDNAVFPRGCVCIVATRIAAGAPGVTRPFAEWMLDQDTGGAIRAAGRADLYFGIGPAAERLAGEQLSEGRLYYLFLKPDRVEFWRRQMDQGQPTVRGQ